MSEFKEKLEDRLIPHYERCPFIGDGQDCERAFMAGAREALRLAAEEIDSRAEGYLEDARQADAEGDTAEDIRSCTRFNALLVAVAVLRARAEELK